MRKFWLLLVIVMLGGCGGLQVEEQVHMTPDSSLNGRLGTLLTFNRLAPTADPADMTAALAEFTVTRSNNEPSSISVADGATINLDGLEYTVTILPNGNVDLETHYLAPTN